MLQIKEQNLLIPIASTIKVIIKAPNKYCTKYTNGNNTNFFIFCSTSKTYLVFKTKDKIIPNTNAIA